MDNYFTVQKSKMAANSRFGQSCTKQSNLAISRLNRVARA